MTQIYRFIEASASHFIDLLVKIDRRLNMSGWRPTFHRGARQSDLYIQNKFDLINYVNVSTFLNLLRKVQSTRFLFLIKGIETKNLIERKTNIYKLSI